MKAEPGLEFNFKRVHVDDIIYFKAKGPQVESLFLIVSNLEVKRFSSQITNFIAVH